jgi:hypothetical protein
MDSIFQQADEALKGAERGSARTPEKHSIFFVL